MPAAAARIVFDVFSILLIFLEKIIKIDDDLKKRSR